MSELSLTDSLAQARQRVGTSSRKRRSDAGRSRLAPPIERELARILRGQERPRVTAVYTALRARAARLGLDPPARASIYNAMDRLEAPTFLKRDLPDAVQRVLHNVADGLVPGHHVAFAAFNYGDERALSFAAGLPWICLHRAARMRGFRPKSRALLHAVMSFRRI
jgi:hypothetical protein